MCTYRHTKKIAPILYTPIENHVPFMSMRGTYYFLGYIVTKFSFKKIFAGLTENLRFAANAILGHHRPTAGKTTTGRTDTA